MEDVLHELYVQDDDGLSNLLSKASSLEEFVNSIESWSSLPASVIRWAGNGPKSEARLPPFMEEEFRNRVLLPAEAEGEFYAVPSTAGTRVLCSMIIYSRRFELIGTALDACVTDLFDMLTACLDLLTLADAKHIANYLWRSKDLLEPLFNDGDQSMKNYLANPSVSTELKTKFTQRLIPGRAMLICVSNGLVSILRTDVSDYRALSRVRMLPYLVLPENFEGISNRHRGKEPPAISRSWPANVACLEEERDLLQQWTRTIDTCRTLRMGIGAGVNFTSFILLRRAWAFLQDPGEYLAQCLASNGTSPCKIEELLGTNNANSAADEVLEEGEAIDESHAAAASLKSSDVLCKRFRELEQLGLFFQKRLKSKENRKKISILELNLLPYHMLPHGFIELFTDLPQIASTFAANIIVGLKVQFQWLYGAESTDNSLLHNWAANVTLGVIHAYKRALQALLPCVSTELLDECNEALGFELKTLSNKFDKIATPQVKDNVKLPEVPPININSSAFIHGNDTTNQTRLNRFLQAGIDRINVISATSVDDLRDLSLEPVDLTAWRQEAFIESDLPPSYGDATHEERLAQRWSDVKERQALDADEANEIDPSERFVSSQLNCWRTLRALTLSGTATHLSYPPDRDNDLGVFLKLYQ